MTHIGGFGVRVWLWDVGMFVEFGASQGLCFLVGARRHFLFVLCQQDAAVRSDATTPMPFGRA